MKSGVKAGKMPTPKERNLFKKDKQLGRLIVVLTQLSAPSAGNAN